MGAAKLTESEYTTIKQLLTKGYEGQQVAEIVGRANSLVSRVKNSDNFKDYIGKLKAKHEKPKAKQLPLDVPKKTTLDVREDIAIKVNALRDAIALYKSTAAGSNAVKQIRYCQKAQERIEEAWLWIKEGF